MLVPHDYWIFENAELNSAFKLNPYGRNYNCVQNKTVQDMQKQQTIWILQ